MTIAEGTFDVTLSPLPPEADEVWGRMSLTKTWHGAIEGTGRGLMMSAGDPGRGRAGYVALESVDGTLDGRRGTFCLQQCGTMDGESVQLDYMVVPGSGTGELEGLTGTLSLTVEPEGIHRYSLEYTLG